MMFREHIEKAVTSSKVKVGILMRTFSTRHKEAMIKMFNTCIRSKLDFGNTVWSSSSQTEIGKLE